MSIIFAELYGQKNYKKLRKESFLSLSAEGGFTIVLSIISLLVLYPVLGADTDTTGCGAVCCGIS